MANLLCQTFTKSLKDFLELVMECDQTDNQPLSGACFQLNAFASIYQGPQFDTNHQVVVTSFRSLCLNPMFDEALNTKSTEKLNKAIKEAIKDNASLSSGMFSHIDFANIIEKAKEEDKDKIWEQLDILKKKAETTYSLLNSATSSKSTTTVPPKTGVDKSGNAKSQPPMSKPHEVLPKLAQQLQDSLKKAKDKDGESGIMNGLISNMSDPQSDLYKYTSQLWDMVQQPAPEEPCNSSPDNNTISFLTASTERLIRQSEKMNEHILTLSQRMARLETSMGLPAPEHKQKTKSKKRN